MRKLTVNRRTQTVASLGKVSICIEVESNEDIKFDYTKLKKIGTLKNGESKEFTIPKETSKVYVVFSKIMPQKFHSVVWISEGTDDLELYTFSRYSPFAGNPFVISLTEEMSKKEMKRNKPEISFGTKLLYFLMIIGSVIIGYYIGFNAFS